MKSPKERIIDTTFVLFAKQGYNSTGINQIISEAGVAKASFYQHFRSKEDLCIEFLNVRHEYWFSEMRNFLCDAKDVRSKVLSAFDFLIYMNQKEDFRGCSFLNILSEIPTDYIRILSVIQSHKSDLRKYFSDLLQDDMLSDHIYLLFESSIIESQLFRSNELIEKSKNIVANLIS
ncbi:MULTISPECIES: TetR/AcrR family transcriptional regulator [Chryseobacterium]|uniref:AcrR family transcriptional regulator n=1 Tax=Chryseobacterium camelliae TaxID=1265445 RepID=A0ABU0TD46_9FLAO|nr:MULTISPECIES: TetR/AcrR family transcriptional regulator [Chryseobacterium]MDT3407203.1 AcrR family transcriptional regulator [Pseudacidovorax intermedius]MDQ1095006.1 AcrR family transcriptional regulator [Chryseobacterium camelliae]MDQ1098946.1 AcrR family transcriptional regulator [Chryseobacterium sp. SORGH_AS_1048]MDR6086294.1 AcrR family transcriptional regulator [Chryseobacterium sp. SORGH_AS_0909]MDR6130666.1 AcrR family transcriptional regulator [Chryseobacterium sp. SORGH_AS_1175]